MKLATILDALDKHEALAKAQGPRAAFHQRQADRILERLGKCERVDGRPALTYSAVIKRALGK